MLINTRIVDIVVDSSIIIPNKSIYILQKVLVSYNILLTQNYYLKPVCVRK